MTLAKRTVPQIKSELDDLGIVYRSNLRKAELLSLLEASLAPVTAEDPHYSPPYTRRRTTMAAVDLQKVGTNLLKLDSSPLNHASAVIDELEAVNNQSEEVSVDVHITKEDVGADEHVILQEEQVIEEKKKEKEEVTSNGISSPVEEEEEVSGVTDSDEELEKEVISSKEGQEVIVKTKTIKRRSERIKKKHEACSGALFSDDEQPSPEPVVEEDSDSTTSSQEARATDRKSMLLKIFFLFILFAVISNVIAYLYLSYPVISDALSSFTGLFKSDSSSPDDEL